MPTVLSDARIRPTPAERFQTAFGRGGLYIRPCLNILPCKLFTAHAKAR
ncbi:hypothetical protein [Neisseria montereyensis]|uniref:Uncharacterized protein n=1 Tax=Neisseria montereyensis TaxID=2973938 RepID=A0ABT2F9S1_9NEIS|nr:hypothetical protein [Neisseria montereyensis]MCS4532892.1 hypothetical protein [Neisseria montereyensis]